MNLPNDGVVWLRAQNDKRYRKMIVTFDAKNKTVSLKPMSMTTWLSSSTIKFDANKSTIQVLPAEKAVEIASEPSNPSAQRVTSAGMIVEENYFRVLATGPKGAALELHLRGRTEHDRDRWVNFLCAQRGRPQTEEETYPYGRVQSAPVEPFKRKNTLWEEKEEPSPSADESKEAAPSSPLGDIAPMVVESDDEDVPEPLRKYSPASLKHPPSSDPMRVPQIAVIAATPPDQSLEPTSEGQRVTAVSTAPRTFEERAKELAQKCVKEEQRTTMSVKRKFDFPFASSFAAAVLNAPAARAPRLLSVPKVQDSSSSEVQVGGREKLGLDSAISGQLITFTAEGQPLATDAPSGSSKVPAAFTPTKGDVISSVSLRFEANHNDPRLLLTMASSGSVSSPHEKTIPLSSIVEWYSFSEVKTASETRKEISGSPIETRHCIMFSVVAPLEARFEPRVLSDSLRSGELHLYLFSCTSFLEIKSLTHMFSKHIRPPLERPFLSSHSRRHRTLLNEARRLATRSKVDTLLVLNECAQFRSHFSMF